MGDLAYQCVPRVNIHQQEQSAAFQKLKKSS